MAVVRELGKPHIFATMTMNPTYDEVEENLFTNQTATDRPDLIARIFRLKVKEFINDLTKKHVKLFLFFLFLFQN